MEVSPKAYPFREALSRLGLKSTKGHELIKQGPNGEPPLLQSYTVGRFRFVTAEALRCFIEARLAEAMNTTPERTAERVRPAVEARQLKRQLKRQAEKAAEAR